MDERRSLVGHLTKPETTPSFTVYNSSLFVCVEVLRPSQPNMIMSNVVSLSNHTFTGKA